jgi:hypothetical protein
MKCRYCGENMPGAHANKRYCTKSCANKARYQRCGQRSTPEQRSQWYENRKEQSGYIEKLRRQGNSRNRKVKAFLAEYKISKGCADCGYKEHHCALDFDHVAGTKKFNVCFAKSIHHAKTEIKKCEVVCSNCHRIRTWERLRD